MASLQTSRAPNKRRTSIFCRSGAPSQVCGRGSWLATTAGTTHGSRTNTDNHAHAATAVKRAIAERSMYDATGDIAKTKNVVAGYP